MTKIQKEVPIDPSIKSFYESSPFDPMAQVRMTGRFLGKVINYRGKITLFVLISSLILGLGFLLSGIYGRNPIASILGSLILLNLVTNKKRRVT